MKKQSYDVPAYRFGIVKINGSQKGQSHSVLDYQNALASADCIIIPFENIDGLTMSEIQQFIRLKEVHFIAYQYYEAVPMEKYEYNIIAQAYLDEQMLNGEPQTPIDQAIERTLEENYNKFDSQGKRVCHCFFERYQDKEYEITKDRIKRLEQAK